MNWSRLYKNGWRSWHLIMALGLVVAAVLACLESWRDITTIAMKDEESSHVMLVPVVAAWLVWVRRERLRRLSPSNGIPGAIAIAVGALLTDFGEGHGMMLCCHTGAVLMAAGALVAVCGFGLVRAFFPVFGLLVFLIPVPPTVRHEISIPLEHVTAVITQQCLEVLGASVERSGNLLSVNGIPVTIAEACNGLRMVFALVLVSYAFAFGTALRAFIRFVVLAISPLSAVFFNILRLIPAMSMYGYSSKAWADRFHDMSGWVMLPVAFLFMLGVVQTMRWALIPIFRFNLAQD